MEKVIKEYVFKVIEIEGGLNCKEKYLKDIGKDAE